MKKFFNVFMKIIFVFLIMIILIYLFEIKVMKEKYLNLFGYAFFEVLTGSMEDTINIGDMVVINITQYVKVNDIIAFEEDENLIIHRLVNIEEDKVITKGDANNEEDNPIKKEQIIGKKCFEIKNFKTWKKIILIILIVTMLLMYLV